MIEVIALSVVAATGLFLAALGGAGLVAPSRAGKFLLGFAGSPSKHYAELGLRFLVGGAFILSAPQARIPGAFHLFGWVLLATTAGLLLVPWRWHHRFAQRAVPAVLRFLPLVGIASLVLGGLVLWSMRSGVAV
jgi:hypothetical protein